MNTPFENDWKRTLEGAPADEAVPAFDEAAGWNAVQARLSRDARRGRIRKLSIGGATLLLLFLAGWMAWRGGNDAVTRGKAGANVARTSPQSFARPAVPRDAVLQDTSAPQPAPSTSVKKAVVLPMADAVPAASNSSNDTLVPVATPAPEAAADTAVQDLAPAQKEPSKKDSPPKQPAVIVLHLLDIPGGGQSALRAPVKPMAGRPRGFFSRLLSRNKVPDLTGTAAADAVVQRTYLSR